MELDVVLDHQQFFLGTDPCRFLILQILLISFYPKGFLTVYVSLTVNLTAKDVCHSRVE
jgi:hypothetical protein